jgi:ADP-dependent phosphofructokinase/glucokinase
MTQPVVLGLGGTVDFELHWGAAALEACAAELGIRIDELDGDAPIRTERDLVISILSFMRSGAGGERFVASSRLLVDFADRFTFEVTLGGTGVRAGLAARLLGTGSTQHLVSIDDTVRRLLPHDIDYICSADRDTLDPHLIVQYPARARIAVLGGVIESPHANRLIFAHDPPNRELVLSDRLAPTLEHAKLFVVSGFNSMQEADLLATRVAQLREAMRSLPDDALVIFEDAGYHEPSYGLVVLSGLAEALDVYSLNEDELQLRVGRTVDLMDPDDVASAVEVLRTLAPVPVIVLHTRHYALVSASEPDRWLPVLEGGVVMSGSRYRNGDTMTAADLQTLTREGRRSSAGIGVVTALAAAPAGPDGMRLAGVPAFDLDVASPTTIGLGDSFIGGMVAELESQRLRRAEASAASAQNTW